MKECPKCGKDLKLKVIGTIEVDECESCKGIWLDKGELREAKDLADPNLNWLDFEIWKHEDKFSSNEGSVECPTCHIPTVGIEYGHTGVNVDYCKNCHGVWLDKDELPNIIGALETEINEKTFSEYVHESIKEAKELVTGHESFMSEWKDLSSVFKLRQYRLYVEKPELVETLTDLNTINPFK